MADKSKKPKKEVEQALLQRRFVRINEAAAFLGFTVRQLRDFVQYDLIPYSRPGGKILIFDLKLLVAWQATQQKQPREI